MDKYQPSDRKRDLKNRINSYLERPANPCHTSSSFIVYLSYDISSLFYIRLKTQARKPKKHWEAYTLFTAKLLLPEIREMLDPHSTI